MAFVENYVEGVTVCLQELLQQNVAEIADAILKAQKDGRQIYIMGNGGSAATASHFANDLKLRTTVEGKPGIRVTSLTDNIAIITAIGNDTDYSSIFMEQLVGRLTEGDVVIGISASGNSPNVLKAMEFAKSNGAITVGFIGFNGGKLKELSDKCVVLSSSSYEQIEDTHLCLAHILACLVREGMANA